MDDAVRGRDVGLGDVRLFFGVTNAAVRIAPQRLAELTGTEWVDVTRRGDHVG